MTTIQKCLHSEGDDMKLVNVKFFRGDNKYISPEEFRAQLCVAAEFQKAHPEIRTGVAPRSAQPQVNVRDLVANL